MKTCNNPRKTLTGLRAKAQNIFGCDGCFLWVLEVTKTELSLFSSLFFFVKRKLTKKKLLFFNSSVSDHLYHCHRVVEFSCFTYTCFLLLQFFKYYFFGNFVFVLFSFFSVTAFQLIQK